MVKTAEAKLKIRRVINQKEPAICGRLEAMNDYAARVRVGQSSSMGKEESRALIIKALEGQGYTDFDGLIIPA
jgi:hypothetical protein